MQISHKNKVLELKFPQIMGILNVTPDSFSDGGKYVELERALFYVEEMLAQGASIIDVGGESTRPNADEVSVEAELERVVPVVEAISKRFDCWISVDTSKALVMEECAKVGMDLINDIRALQEPNALKIASQLDIPVCLMHMQGQPQTMQQSPSYQDVVQEVKDFLIQRTKACNEAGIKQIIWDVGFGFGKTLHHNYQLLHSLKEFTQEPYPMLVGISRKSMVGNLLNIPMEERTVASVTASLLAVQQGAKILRVHDVKAMQDALKIWQAMENPSALQNQ